MSENKDICSPVHLTLLHETEDFHSGEETPDTWLRERVFANMEASASRTYVICPSGSRKVIGSMRRNMLRQIPAVILGRLAIDRKWQDQRFRQSIASRIISVSLNGLTHERKYGAYIVHN